MKGFYKRFRSRFWFRRTRLIYDMLLAPPPNVSAANWKPSNHVYNHRTRMNTTDLNMEQSVSLVSLSVVINENRLKLQGQVRLCHSRFDTEHKTTFWGYSCLCQIFSLNISRGRKMRTTTIFRSCFPLNFIRLLGANNDGFTINNLGMRVNYSTILLAGS